MVVLDRADAGADNAPSYHDAWKPDRWAQLLQQQIARNFERRVREEEYGVPITMLAR